MKNVFDYLDSLGIPYQKFDHPAVYTVEEAGRYDSNIPGAKTKNLFLRNKKGNKHFLVVVQAYKRVDIRKLEILLGEKNLSFASPERLEKYLGLKPGSVSPLGLINDEGKEVTAVVDEALMGKGEVAFHPNVNTSTVVMSSSDFVRFLESTGNGIVRLDI